MLYELTLTLRPRMYSKTAQEQFDECYPILRKILGSYKCSCIAELTSENNIHYHAKIDLKTHLIRDSLFNKLRQYNTMFGRKTCTQLQNEPAYDDYMRKDIKKTEEIIKSPYVMDYFEIYGDLNPKFKITTIHKDKCPRDVHLYNGYDKPFTDGCYDCLFDDIFSN